MRYDGGHHPSKLAGFVVYCCLSRPPYHIDEKSSCASLKSTLGQGTVWKKTAQSTRIGRQLAGLRRRIVVLNFLPLLSRPSGPSRVRKRQAISRCNPAVVVAGNDAFLVIRQSGSNSLPSRCDETRRRGKMKSQVGDYCCRPARLLSSIAFLRLSVFFTDGPAQVLSE